MSPLLTAETLVGGGWTARPDFRRREERSHWRRRRWAGDFRWQQHSAADLLGRGWSWGWLLLRWRDGAVVDLELESQAVE